MITRRRYMGAKGSTDIYDTFDWIEASGEPYINTLCLPTTTTELSTKVVLVSGTAFALFGARSTTASSGRYAWGAWYAVVNNNYVFRVDVGDTMPFTGTIAAGTYTIKMTPPLFYYNNTTMGTESYTQATSYPLYLLNFNTAGAAVSIDITGARMYATTITLNGVETRGYIPCKLLQDTDQTWDGATHYAGECGMWDSVNDLFYGNANSTGSFSVGND